MAKVAFHVYVIIHLVGKLRLCSLAFRSIALYETEELLLDLRIRVDRKHFAPLIVQFQP